MSDILGQAVGKNFERPHYKAMLKKLTEGDLPRVENIDRLGRNYEEMLEQWRVLTREKRMDIRVLDMALLDTRQAEGIAATKRRGVRFGRRAKLVPGNFLENFGLWKNGGISGGKLHVVARCP